MITTVLLVWAVILLGIAIVSLRGRAHFNPPKPNLVKAESVLDYKVVDFIPSKISVDAVVELYEREMRILPEGWDG